jgi:N-acetylglutamate synthase-like GNAT family acetyltransferase
MIMRDIKIQILPYQELYQQEIDFLMDSVAKEFIEPISTKSIAKNILQPDMYLVAMIENKVVGTISVTKLKNNNSVLRKMFLHKYYRGQGIAELLLQRVINWANDNHVNSIYLGTMAQFTTAQKFYERLNFEQIDKGLLPTDFPLNPIDSIFYKLNLIQSLK